MKNVGTKLRSETGASITYALLLFLVCAVVGSVVLVAATSASGRLSGLAETDQRYYSVTSAAEYMKDRFDRKEVTVVKEEITETVTPYTYDGGAAGGGSSSTQTHYYIDGTEVTSGYRPDSLLRDAAYRLYVADPAPEYPVERDFTLQEKSGSDRFSGVTVRGVTSLDEDGTMSVTIQSRSDDETNPEKGVYSMRLTFTADGRTVEDDRTEEGTAQETAI